jgi:hypothetical protein
MVKGGKNPSSAAGGGKTPAPNTAKGGKQRQQDEKAIDETVSHV